MTEEFEQEHSERGPSTAHRWVLCPGSVARSRGLPDDAGIEAALGTMFHEIAAICVEQGLDPFGFIGAKMEVEPHGTITFDEEMANAMQDGLDLIESYCSDSTILIVERKVSLKDWVGEGEFGTADVIIIDVENWRLVCFDWKYGMGVVVQPHRNLQAMLYTLGTWSMIARELFQDEVMKNDPSGAVEAGAPWDDDVEVHIVIEQPRAPGGGGIWKTTMGYVLAEGERIREAAKATELEDAPIVPGVSQCKFCKAAKFNQCPERAEWIMGMAQIDLDAIESADQSIDLPAPIDMTPEQRAVAVRHKTLIEQFLSDLHAIAYQDATIGREVPGMKLVKGRRPKRVWKDPDKAEVILTKRLGADAHHEPKLLSPSEAEKTVGKGTYREHYSRLVYEGDAKPVLVAEDAPGEPIKAALDYLPEPDDAETLV